MTRNGLPERLGATAYSAVYVEWEATDDLET